EIAKYFQQGDIAYTGKIEPINAEVIMAPYKEAITTAYNEVFGYYMTVDENGQPVKAPTDSLSWNELKNQYQWFEVGTVGMKGDYSGYKLVLVDIACDGPCFSPNLYRFLWNDLTDELVFLPQYSTTFIQEWNKPLFEKRDTTGVAFNNVELPDELSLPQGKEVVRKALENSNFLRSDSFKVAFTHPDVGDVYFVSGSENPSFGCFYVQAPDGSFARYEYDPGFFAIDGDSIGRFNDGLNGLVDGTSFNLNADYTYTVGGCGITGNCYTIVKADPKNLTLAGKTDAGGVEFYTVKDPIENASAATGATAEQIAFAESYKTYTSMYQWKVEQEGYTLLTFDEYVTLKPMLYWQDPLGRWSTLSHVDVKPLAECGKPVVYLYPETPMDVQVKVEETVFTKTIPEHGTDGWAVRAYPGGAVYNYGDGATYPYLFWEGVSKPAVSLDRGFMVERDDLEGFLNDALDQMGFLAHEKTDFMEFWLSRMLDNTQHYFFVSFVGTEDMNAIAPLSITPQPDTLARVFMFYHPTDTAFYVEPQVLNPVSRYGFNVFEWGGTSSIPWHE
ncbi:MAG: hypothetical protein UW70_C0064G0009, partial [Candidatus Peregrinibacteria bacterium GW2011_GWA2_44_7]